ncbi:MAG: leucine-rich repeat protein [Lachnospiraceae bacterium]|nr:leucine-rich repeat protein [Lachnospiraceae bacterium]
MNKRKDVQMMERKDPASAVICTSKILETYAFREEKTLQRIVLSEGVEVIGAKAFFGCSNLEYISLPSTLTNVDMRAFDGCDRLRQIDYNGNRAQWREIEISMNGNAALREDRVHFLQSETEPMPDSPIDRYERDEKWDRKVCAYVRDLLRKGGDGTFYVVFPNLNVKGVTVKPGDMVFLVLPSGETVMIDTGIRDVREKILAFLKGIDLNKLDYLIISHPDIDHIGNAMETARFICEEQGGSIGDYMVNSPIDRNHQADLAVYLFEHGTNISNQVRAGYQWTVGDVEVQVFGPRDEDFIEERDYNNQALVLRFRYGNSTFLTCGDIYYSKENYLMEIYGSQLQADVIKTNHHGCYTSNSNAWIDVVKPHIAVSCTNDNGCTMTCRAFAERGITHYSTGLEGTIVISMDEKQNYQVATEGMQIRR